MSGQDNCVKVVTEVLASRKDELNHLSQEIWKHPEENFEERFAHQLLTTYLESNGFAVTREYKKLETAFRAEFQSSKYEPALHPTIAVLCEYDALPGIGHACGHNLIAEAGVAAGLAVKGVLKGSADWKDAERVEGRIVVMGTPAEEGGGGKVVLLKSGAFDDIDFAMMVHPFGYNGLEPMILSIETVAVKYYGKAAHASCGPWEGVNALDAAVGLYQIVSNYRQQMKPDWRIHGIILEGGLKANIIPDKTKSSYSIRARTQVDQVYLRKKFCDFVNAVALATGCTVEMEWSPNPYSAMIHCSSMSRLYAKFSADAGVVFAEGSDSFAGSTDMGNVSVNVPSIHPGFAVGHPTMIHSEAFQKLAGSEEAQKYTLIAGQSMALTCLEIFKSKKLQEEIKAEFAAKKKSFSG